uniref:O-methylsterigmatocystin oxidoreductase n=1 Tax=Bionectria ochroleuca TaxID=29856 RepID=A0A8H7K273_BIOOC
MLNIILLAQSAIAISGLCLAYEKWRRKSRISLPPGPKPLPIVGNVLDLPPKGLPEARHWESHHEKYGPITSITAMGQTIVVLHDRNLAVELLDKGGAKNSSRPWLEFGWRMCGFGQFTIGQPYGDTLRLHRKLILQHIGSKQAVALTQSLLEREVGRTLVRMLEFPDNLFKNVEIQGAAIILKLTYGYDINTKIDDPLLFVVRRRLDRLGAAVMPGGWLVDAFPILRHIPAWCPGAGFKQTAIGWNREVLEAVNIPFQFVKRQLGDNSCQPSADTTYSTFTLVVAKAHEEIDRVIGPNRLPTFADQDQLPYIDGIIKEAYRWQSVVPQGLAHSSDEDQVFQGYFIPKGAAVIANTFAYTRDTRVYHDPEAFLPERYMAPYNELDPKEYVFGLGRVEIDPILEVQPGIVAHPKEYPYRLTPRSEAHALLIRSNLPAGVKDGQDHLLLKKYDLNPDR